MKELIPPGQLLLVQQRAIAGNLNRLAHATTPTLPHAAQRKGMQRAADSMDKPDTHTGKRKAEWGTKLAMDAA